MYRKEDYLIDRASPMPAYQQIASNIIARISQGEWELNERLPSEDLLAECYGVSRVTLRQALALLEKDEIIAKYQGKGIFVIDNPNLIVQDLSFPTLETGKSERAPMPSRILVIAEEAEPPRKVKSRLRLSAGAPAIFLKRLFVSEESAIGVNNVWFPKEMVPGFIERGLLDLSVSKTLREAYHHNIVAIDNQIEATKLDAVNARLLNSAYDAPALKIDSVHLLADDRPVEFASTIWTGKTTRFRFRVTRD
ncbi:MAG: GntR family transcriptional regulator [Peptococcaceae bacterium]|jgi:GntR family transcriptional regulator|nr:GntR family transcriptional regulator [Peptococcaceae bacterium]